jgi:hypothetical protein
MTFIFKRILWVLANIYFWFKLCDYLDLWRLMHKESEYLVMLELSVNIPIYVGVFSYLYSIKLPPKIFWKIWSLLAILDEVRALIISADPFNAHDFWSYTSPTIPLYCLCLLYAYGCKYLWASNIKYGYVPRIKP